MGRRWDGQAAMGTIVLAGLLGLLVGVALALGVVRGRARAEARRWSGRMRALAAAQAALGRLDETAIRARAPALGEALLGGAAVTIAPDDGVAARPALRSDEDQAALAAFTGTVAAALEAARLRDEAARAAAPEERRDRGDRLRQAQKLEAIGRLAGGIAHDVNNLLTVILGNLELLALRAEERSQGIADEEPGLDVTLTEAGLRAGESASQLMHRLLAFSRRQPAAPSVIDLGERLDSLQKLLRRTLSEQVAIRVRWPDDLWPALLDPADLESAILNLAINAQDAMPAGGTLSIEAANLSLDQPRAAARGMERPGDYVLITVGDSGTGMPAEVLQRAFDAFFTTKEPGKGTGLGLSMVQGFARQSGGQVTIASTPGAGTTVSLLLPRAAPVDSAAPAAGEAGVTGGNEAILLVEDNELVRTHAETTLSGLGYRVATAGDGAAALGAIEGGFRPDLLVTDVVLPGAMTGRDVAEAAQRKLPGLRVLFISGYAGNVLMENGRLPPGVDLLGKPFRRSELAQRIRAQLGEAPPRRPAWRA
jgi:signal transduction histidine kinase/CheY-like chemotaxis protein